MIRIALMAFKSIFNLPFWFYQIKYYSNLSKNDVNTRYNFIRNLVRTVNKRGQVIIKEYGLDNLPKDDGFVLYPNHQGLFDALAIIETLERPITAVSKIELKNTFFIKDIFQILEAKFIERSDVRSTLKVMMEVTKEVSNGRNYIIFPEGTRSKSGNSLGEFKGGSFKVSINSKTPIVPVAIIDSYKIFDSNSMKKQVVQLHYLKPLYYEDYIDMKSPDIATYVSNEITKVIKQYTLED